MRAEIDMIPITDATRPRPMSTSGSDIHLTDPVMVAPIAIAATTLPT